jgi:hypothetical protein
MASVFSSAGWRQRACGSARLSWWGVSLVRAEWGCLTSSCVESGGKWRENLRGFSELEQRNATQRKVLGNPSGVMNVVRLSCMKDTSPWCDYLVLASKPLPAGSDIQEKRECPYQNPSPRERTCEEACCYRDIYSIAQNSKSSHLDKPSVRIFPAQ